MAGPELASRIAARRPEIKVLLMSGYADRVASDSELPLLQKPLTPEALARKIRETLL